MIKKLILGTKSPRRKEVLSYFSYPFEQIPSGFDEEQVKFEGDPEKHCGRLALEKGNVLTKQYPEAVILTADTIVFCEGKLYEKPKSPEEGFEILKHLSGRMHTVYTGVAVCEGSERRTHVEGTDVTFHELSDEQIRSYQSAMDCEDKAGGYAIQHAGSLLVKKIDGCFYNVVGLPIQPMYRLLLPSGIDLWQYIRT